MKISFNSDYLELQCTRVEQDRKIAQEVAQVLHFVLYEVAHSLIEITAIFAIAMDQGLSEVCIS